MRKPLLLLFVSLACLAAVFVPEAAFGQVSFSGLDVSSKDRLLFSANALSPGFGSFDTLFLAEAKTKNLRQLTIFPEEVLLLQDNEVLQIQNRYGVFRSKPGLQSIQQLPSFSSFAGGSQIQIGKIEPMHTSPDGRYLLFLRPRSPAFGDLTLIDVASSKETILADKVERSFDTLPAIWSPDSQMIVYAKSGTLYYYSLRQLQDGSILAESLRRIGDGTIANVQWGRGRSLYYVSGVVVYAIDANALFTRALYTGFLQIGEVRGKIPFAFDPNFDSFWISPDGTRMILNKGLRNLFLYSITASDFHGTGDPLSLPYLFLPRDTTVRKVIWPTSGTVTVLCETLAAGVKSTSIYRLARDAKGNYANFELTEDKGVSDMVLSPDQLRVALLRSDEVVWKDYPKWLDQGRFAHPSPLHVLWLSDDEILIAGAWLIERHSVTTGGTRLVTLSQPGEYGHAESSESVVTRSKGVAYSFNEQTGSWEMAASYAAREKSVASENYRVYLESSTRGSYSNVVMVREAKEYGTAALFPSESSIYEPFPTREEAVDFGNFSYGSRIRRREVSLVFNLIDSAEGLTEVLNTLAAYRVRCTFFVNGEFIRRYPDAVKEIADSGHEVGSMFTVHFNMTDSRFKVGRDLVKEGLGRNEDDYFAATGLELATKWHAPYYIVNSEIISWAAEMNYTYVGRDIDSYDWVSKSETNMERGIYFPGAQLIERIISTKKPGSIISMQIGAVEGGRDDYLFQKLDLLVNELAILGYSVVPVSTLIEHAR